MVALPVEVQGRRLLRAFPTFQPVTMAGWFGIWEGTLQPVMQTYRVRIRYIRYSPFTLGVLSNSHVEVFVLDPKVGQDPRGTGEPIPHVFRLGHDPEFPALCLFDPARREWSPEDHVADTIVPWAIEWLMWFELWLWDGVWRGGGRHPGETIAEHETVAQEADSSPTKSSAQADRPGPSRSEFSDGVSRLALLGPLKFLPVPAFFVPRLPLRRATGRPAVHRPINLAVAPSSSTTLAAE
jgi:hypothetical protein